MSDHDPKRGVRECDASMLEVLSRQAVNDVKVVIAVDGEGCQHIFCAPCTTIEVVSDEGCGEEVAAQPMGQTRGATASRGCPRYLVTLPNGQRVWMTIC